MLKCPKCLSETMSTVCSYCGNKIITLESLMGENRYGGSNPKDPSVINDIKAFHKEKPLYQFHAYFSCGTCGVQQKTSGLCPTCMKKSRVENSAIEKENQTMPTGPTPKTMCNKNCLDCKCPKAQTFAAIPEVKIEDLSDFAKGNFLKLKKDTESIIKSQTQNIELLKLNLQNSESKLQKAEENLKKEQYTLSFLEKLLKE